MTLRRWLPALVGLLIGLVLAALLLRGPREQTGVPDATSMVGVATSDPGPRPSSVPLKGTPLTQDDADAADQPNPATTARPRGAPAPITGVVLDHTGRTIEGARLTLLPIDPRSMRGAPFPDGAPIGEVQSERDGTFTFAEAPAGRWLRVLAEADGYARSAQRVSSAGAHLVFALAPGGSLEATVYASDAKPLGGATVEIVLAEFTTRGTTGADDGVARLDALPAGEVRLRVRHPAHGTILVGPYATVPGEVTRVAVQLPPGVTLTGRVVDDETDAPIRGATILIAHPGRSTDAGTTDSDGVFAPVHAGGVDQRVFVSAVAEGYAPVLQAVVLMAGGDAPQSTDIRMKAAEPWRGEVMFPRGHPDKRARVYYLGTGIAGLADTSTMTDDSGRFTLPPPPVPAPGRRVVLMAEAGALQGAVALRPHQPKPSPLFVVLSRGAEVKGRLKDKEGAPIAGAQVRLYPDWQSGRSEGRATLTPAESLLRAANDRGLESLAASSDKTGAFVFQAIPPATYRVQVTLRGVPRFVGESVAVGEDGLALGDLTLGAGAVLEGRVSSSTGVALPGARVRLLTQNLRVTTDAEGAFRFEDVPAGPHQVEASCPATRRFARPPPSAPRAHSSTCASIRPPSLSLPSAMKASPTAARSSRSRSSARSDARRSRHERCPWVPGASHSCATCPKAGCSCPQRDTEDL